MIPSSTTLPRCELTSDPGAAWEQRTTPCSDKPARGGGGTFVAQVGARMHYAVPRILSEVGALDRLCTDICAVKGWPRALPLIPGPLRPRSLQRLMGRVPRGIDPAIITAFTGFGFAFARRHAKAASPADILSLHLWAGRTFSTLARDRALSNTAAAVYCFNSAGLELMRAAAERGMRTIVEQTIAPRGIGARLLHEENAAYPGWEGPPAPDDLVAALADREAREWSAADLIVCGSDFVRDGIAAEGGPAERCVVIPYGVDQKFALAPKTIAGRDLHVLTIGEVGLRKGSPYVAEAARRAGRHITFRMVGNTILSAKAQAEMKKNVELAGPTPRAAIHQHYCWADVFLLPSLYEGSATVVYEALAAGLPVICTPNTGSIVRDGIDGYIVPIRDVDAILDRLERLSDPGVRQEMSNNARFRAREGQLAAYRDRLLHALDVGMQ